MTEMPGGGYLERTRQNVVDSDGTLTIFFGELSGGTEKTVRICAQLGKPWLSVDGLKMDAGAVAVAALEFIKTRRIQVLNVAGPRESGYKGGREFAERAVALLLGLVKEMVD